MTEQANRVWMVSQLIFRMSTSSLLHKTAHGRPGVYSAERRLALQQYQQHTSTTRAISVCLLTPMPALVYLIAVEALMPLAPPEKGWKANYVVTIRVFVLACSTAFCTMESMHYHMPTLQVTPRQFILAAIATSLLHTGCLLALCAVWVFPIPFAATLTAGVFTTFCGISIVIFIGVKPFQDVPNFRRKLTLYIAQLSLLNFLIVAYPAYGAFYRTLHGSIQTASIVILIVLKLLAKKVTTALIRELDGDDFVPVVTQFSVELVHSLSITTCVQTTPTPVQVVVLIVVFDYVPLAYAYHAIYQLTRGSSSSRSTTQVLPSPAPRRLTRTKSKKISASQADETMSQALHASENHLLMEYIEFMIPCYYAIYVAVLFFLPNAQFYDTMKSVQSIESLQRFLRSVAMLALLQAFSVVVFCVILSRQALLNVSMLHQLSFVLETHRGFVQCWLFAWIPFCILSSVQHGGMDFSLRFEWMKKAT